MNATLNETANLATENARLTAAMRSAVQHLERGRPSIALRELNEALDFDGSCASCGADREASRPYIIPGVSCMQCGAQTREER